MRFRAIWMVALLGLLLAALAANGFRGRMGLTLTPQSPAELSALLSPAFTWTLPEGAGPFPTALLLSGCDGPKPNLTDLAQALAEAGWASLIIDSHGPRGFDDYNAWRLVCAGQVLNGAERAGDIAVALDAVCSRPKLDADRVALIGLSHGGWSALDFLALSQGRAPPPLLTDWPATCGRAPAEGVQKAVLFYPYCGPAAVASGASLPTAPDYLFLLVENDSVASETACLTLAERMERADAEVTVEVFSGVTHGFDQKTKAEFSTLDFDPEAKARAFERTLRFLEGQ